MSDHSDKMDRPERAGDPPTDVLSRQLNLDPWISVGGATAGITGIRVTIENGLTRHLYTVGHMSSITSAAHDTVDTMAGAQSSLSLSTTSQQAHASESSRESSPWEEGPVATGAPGALRTISPPSNKESRESGMGGGPGIDRVEPESEGSEKYPDWMIAVLRQCERPH